jgi:hypothetical protein
LTCRAPQTQQQRPDGFCGGSSGGAAIATCSIAALSYTVTVVVYSSVQHILQNPHTLDDVQWGFNLDLGEASHALPVVCAPLPPSLVLSAACARRPQRWYSLAPGSAELLNLG